MTPPFFAIDNMDNALNPKLCQELIKQLGQLAQAHKKQCILSKHNPAILDGLDLTDDMQRLFMIYRNADGHTIAEIADLTDISVENILQIIKQP